LKYFRAGLFRKWLRDDLKPVQSLGNILKPSPGFLERFFGSTLGQVF